MNTRHVIIGHLKLLLTTVFFWVTAFFFFNIFRYAGLEEVPRENLRETVTWINNIKLVVVLGLITGVFYYVVELFLDNNWFKRKTVGIRLLTKLFCYSVVFILDAELGMNVLTISTPEWEYYSMVELFNTAGVFSFMVYFLLASMTFSFYKLVNEKFGPGVFWKMLTGRYTPPRIEKKIFMFLDLKGSTTLAEELGYHKYSRLIQQCFFDLNEVVSIFSGDIYQYVGDEAVISWDYHKGIRRNECVELYFAFRQKLQSRKDYYMHNFGVVPVFKAGIHGGDLMVAEVGVIKKEIAYHGDVINTTARIQSMCNELEELLLTSGDLLESLDVKEKYITRQKGDFVLKGKVESVQLYGIKEL